MNRLALSHVTLPWSSFSHCSTCPERIFTHSAYRTLFHSPLPCFNFNVSHTYQISPLFILPLLSIHSFPSFLGSHHWYSSKLTLLHTNFPASHLFIPLGTFAFYTLIYHPLSLFSQPTIFLYLHYQPILPMYGYLHPQMDVENFLLHNVHAHSARESNFNFLLPSSVLLNFVYWVGIKLVEVRSQIESSENGTGWLWKELTNRKEELPTEQTSDPSVLRLDFCWLRLLFYASFHSTIK